MKNRPHVLSLMLVFTLAPVGLVEAAPVDGITASRGYSPDKDADFYRLGFRHQWDRRWFTEGDWSLGGRFELGLIHLSSDADTVEIEDSPASLNALAFTPVLRYQRRAYGNGLAPFIELGIGISYFSETRLEDDTSFGADFGSHFQFEDLLSVGARFGESLEASLNAAHYSNGDVKQPNEGINVYGVSISYWF